MYVGTVGAAVTSIVYIIITIVLVLGFESNVEFDKQLLFAVLGAVSGILTTNMLRVQGVTLAKNQKKSQEVIAEYNKVRNKTRSTRSLRTITFHMVTAFLTDIISKGATVAMSTMFVMYIYMDGSGDFAMIGLAAANVLMFLSFGLIALAKFYDMYIEQHIPILEERTVRLKEQLAKQQQQLLLNSSEEAKLLKSSPEETPAGDEKTESLDTQNLDQVGSIPLEV